MIRKGISAACLCLLLGVPVAEARTVEITPYVGYRWGGGASYTNGEVSIASAAAYGFVVDYSVADEMQLEFLWSRQPTRLDLSANFIEGSRELFDMTVDTLHGGVIYLYESDGAVEPFAGATVGATRFGPKDEPELDSNWVFSFGLEGGVKIMSRRGLGARLQGRLLFPYVTGNSSYFCGVLGCGSGVGGHTMVQGDLTAGMVFAF